MRIVLIADAFPPLRTSGAVQLRDLTFELVKQGHHVTVLVASPEIKDAWEIEHLNDVQVVRLKTPPTKNIDYARRAVSEILLPIFMLWNLRKTGIPVNQWDGVVWYSPTIFIGLVANYIKKASKCRGYLIVRDIFPEWGRDMGLFKKSAPYYFFKAIANYQYKVADVIGIQSEGNRKFFEKWTKQSKNKIKILQNWLMQAPNVGCSINLSTTRLASRTIFVYAGNMGLAQGMDIMIGLAKWMKNRNDIGFLFVGRGSEVQHLNLFAEENHLDNVLFYDEIDPSEIPGLYAQCHIGLLALDPRHRTHNIPGKFLSYLQAGLPVLASVNAGNDLVQLIESNRVGKVCVDSQVENLGALAFDLMDSIKNDIEIHQRCTNLAAQLFSPTAAAQHIVAELCK